MNQEIVQKKHWDEVANIMRNLKLDYPGQIEQKEFFEFIKFKKEPMNILEIGAGIGRITIPILKMNHFVTATELSDKSLETMKEIAIGNNCAERLTQLQTNFENVDLKDKFDVAVFNAVIHHLDRGKKNKILKNVFNSLKSGGALIALEPNPLNLFYYLLYFERFLLNKKWKNRWYTEKGMLYTSFWHIKNLLHKQGFSGLEHKHYAWLPSKAGNIHKSFLALNKFLNSIPIVKEMSAFIWYKAYKK